VADVLEGRWTTGHAWWGMREGAAHLVGVPDRVPVGLRARIDATRKGVRDGSFAIWKGPLHDNAGQQVLTPGQTADDAFLRRINFYVRGVEGRVPS
jgi:simple sugar transport system substrate-binding protein